VPVLLLLIVLVVPLAMVVRPPPASAGSIPAAARPHPFGWPVMPPHVVRRFDPPPQPWLAGHRGVDLSAKPSAVVRAAGAGTVVYAGVIAGRGVVSVAHPGGFRTTYEPVTSALHAGDPVGAGAVLGKLAPGHPGCPAAACLHWGLRQGDRYLDPLALLGLGRVRLLPLMSGEPPVSAVAR
jgi:murein DD-endopeptidase MepM/ murein hydrolase activator NlpD